jgi:hypothetical protein
VDEMQKWKVIGGTAAAVAVVGGGAAFAAAKLDSPSARSQAIIDDAAGQLGVPSAKLSDALKKAMEDQIQAEVTAGRLTQAQADAMKQRLESGSVPLLGGFGFRGGGFGGGFGFRGMGGLADLNTAATYLGITTSQLSSDLQGGKTLAQEATDKGKTADGLIGALVTAAKAKLDAAVTAGRLTADQRTTIESTLQQRITDFVNGAHRWFAPNFGGTLRHGFRDFAPGGPAAPQGPAPNTA